MRRARVRKSNSDCSVQHGRCQYRRGKKNAKDHLYTISIGQRNAATDLVDQELVFVGNAAGKLVAFRNMIREGLKPPVLVFVDSKVSQIVLKFTAFYKFQINF